MSKNPLPEQGLLNELLRYDQDSGKLFWRVRSIKHFGNTNRQAVWNSRYAGKEAGLDKAYVMVKVMGKAYVAHRLIWKMIHGEEPNEVDHINRDKKDNRLSNLRNVDHSTNMRNRPASRNNTSGHKHISWSKSLQRWVVQLNVPGKGQRQVAWEKCLGAAIVAKHKAMIKYGYNAEMEAA